MLRNSFLLSTNNKKDKLFISFFGEMLEKIDKIFRIAVEDDKKRQHLKEIKEITSELKESYDDWAELRLTQEYLKWTDYIDYLLNWTNNLKKIAKMNTKELWNSVWEYWPIHKEAVRSLVDNSENYIKVSLDWIEQNFSSVLSKIEYARAKQHIAESMVDWTWMFKAQQKIIDDLRSQWITYIKDRSWKTRTLERYANMLVRTETNIANTQWTITRAMELGITKFKIHEQPDCCEHCAEMNGKIVDISKWTVDMPPFHPNCRWYVNAVIEK